jgi:hypothetical protein
MFFFNSEILEAKDMIQNARETFPKHTIPLKTIESIFPHISSRRDLRGKSHEESPDPTDQQLKTDLPWGFKRPKIKVTVLRTPAQY